MRKHTPQPEGPRPGDRPLTGREIVVVVVIMVLSAVLTIAGLPMFGIAELLGGSAFVALRLMRSGPAVAGP
ncbi:hypothetical protein [Streptomyces genisteinicus]|uniref:Uncharacterized protein n=1 Tax=Streptomyces genisteinicus TaxID=2768068 RepID=A0A7H0I5E0_9ACTN|nr:hypothetical protein [Streptomyces genisteinicus]QNP68006.1 hypothetical protein IAG43_34150 [Streptomyces genisteinicus]